MLEEQPLFLLDHRLPEIYLQHPCFPRGRDRRRSPKAFSRTLLRVGQDREGFECLLSGGVRLSRGRPPVAEGECRRRPMRPDDWAYNREESREENLVRKSYSHVLGIAIMKVQAYFSYK